MTKLKRAAVGVVASVTLFAGLGVATAAPADAFWDVCKVARPWLCG